MCCLYAIMTGDIFYVGFSIFILNFHNGLAIPHEYCLSPLNTSDCGKASTPVFSYYKPGSRCEIEFWRGCPTYNKFNDEFLCSHFCIGKLFGFTNAKSEETEINIIDEDVCHKPLDKNDCGSKPTSVYTFDGYSCQNATWRGCTSVNMFFNYSDCLAKCNPSLEKWKEEIENLNEESVEKLDILLNDVVELVHEEIPNATVESTTLVEKLLLNITPESSVENNATEVPKENNATEVPVETTTQPTEVPVETTTQPTEVPVETTTQPTEVPVETTTQPTEVPVETTTQPAEEAHTTPHSGQADEVVVA